MPFFTVIIPCRNGATTLPATLATLKAQDFRDWRAIVVDDGSTDATPLILAAETDARITTLRWEGVGPSNARNIAADAADGVWLACLDADDLWPSDRLTRLARAIEAEPEADGWYGRCAIFTDQPETASCVTPALALPLTAIDCLGENPTCTMSNLVLRADLWRKVDGLDGRIAHAEDLDFLLRLVAAGARIQGIDAILTYYRTSPWGLSADLAAMERGWRAALARAIALGLVPDARTRARAEARQLRYLARRSLRLGAPGRVSARFALRGAFASPRGFFGEFRRGGGTFAASLAAPLTPRPLARALYAR